MERRGMTTAQWELTVVTETLFLPERTPVVTHVEKSAGKIEKYASNTNYNTSVIETMIDTFPTSSFTPQKCSTRLPRLRWYSQPLAILLIRNGHHHTSSLVFNSLFLKSLLFTDCFAVSSLFFTHIKLFLCPLHYPFVICLLGQPVLCCSGAWKKNQSKSIRIFNW